MKISYHWLKQYLNFDLEPEKVSELLTNTGLEVEGLEEIETIKGGLKGLVIGEVLTCQKHPNADKLNTTTVNVGTSEALPIVCGAPNVAVGQKVVVATPGTTLYYDDKPLKIKKSKLRGEPSHGMICAEDELNLGNDHDGIMVLDPKAKVGTPAAEFFNIESDYVFEIGLTPNRTDAISHYGVARDLRAAMLRFGHKGLELNLPSVLNFNAGAVSHPVKVTIHEPKACYRYAGVALTNVKVGPSPDWLQNRLRAIGLSPINNVVDITNFVMHETGHPLHAFDYEKIDGAEINVRYQPQGTTFTTLDEKERKLNQEDLMICDAQKGLVLAGVYGGLQSGVSQKTTSVFLEAAHFNPVVVRKSAKRHALNTDSSFRYERGIDPEMTIYALKRAALLLTEYAEASLASQVVDEHPVKVENHQVDINLERMDQLIGQAIPRKEVYDILQWLEIKIVAENGGQVKLEIPAYRHDVTREADVIEEVLRIYGFNAIEMPGKMQISIAEQPKRGEAQYRAKISQALSARGYLEMINNSLTKASYYREYGFTADASIAMVNPLSQDLDVMRQDLIFGGLEAIAYNVKRQMADLKFFEFGRHYCKKGAGFKETNHLGLWVSGKHTPENWQSTSPTSNFFHLKAEVLRLLETVGLTQVEEQASEKAFFAEGLELSVYKKTVGQLGRVSSALLVDMQIDQPVYYANLNWEVMVGLAQKQKIKMKDLPRYPQVRRDLALLVDQAVAYADLEKAASKAERKLLKAVNLFDVYEGKNLPEGKKSYALSFILQSEQATLKDKEVEAAMQRILKSLKQQFAAELR
jgi:phenylalanyl-tRNA synthetase beta chain